VAGVWAGPAEEALVRDDVDITKRVNRFGSPRRIAAQLLVQISPDSPRAVEALRRWLQLGFEIVGHELRDAVDRTLAEGGYIGRDPSRGVDGGITTQAGITTLVRADGIRKKTRTTFSPRWWDRLRRLTEVPESAHLHISTWNANPSWPSQLLFGEPSMMIYGDEFEEAPDWLLLRLDGPELMLATTPEREYAMLRFLRSVADECGPTFGEVGFHRAGTLLSFPAVDTWSQIRSSREVVCSYSWLTVISEEVGRRLGGVDGLRASGAFHDVARLSRGGFWLQATDGFDEYGREQAHRVFHALAPALPPGLPHRWGGWVDNEPQVIVYEDAANADQCPFR
jgi:hypothetical protein